MLDKIGKDTDFSRSFEVVENGFLTPSRWTSVPGRLSGCLYRADGSKVALSERFGGYRNDAMVSDNPDRLSTPRGAEALPGSGLYLGHLMAGHYGHFIAETLSSFWILEEMEARSFDYFLFHPFFFDTRIRGYVAFCLERFGIDPERIVLGAAPRAFERLVVPERLLRLNHSADARLRWVYATIAGTAVAGAAARRHERHVYISRRRFNARKFSRVIANEVRIEALFRSFGFDIVYPETMSLAEQVALYRGAAVIAGPSGSNLHNSLFAREGTLVIELGDPRYGGEPAPTQTLCDHVAGVRSRFIPFRGRLLTLGERRTMLFDIEHLRLALSEALQGEAGRSGARASAAPSLPAASIRELAEIAYRSVRPAAGYLARRIAGKRKHGPPPPSHGSPAPFPAHASAQG